MVVLIFDSLEDLGDLYETIREEIVDGNMSASDVFFRGLEIAMENVPPEYLTTEEYDIISDLLYEINERI